MDENLMEGLIMIRKKFSIAGCALLLSLLMGVMVNGVNVYANTDLEQKVANTKARNETYRELLSGKNFAGGSRAETFGLTDVDNDGYQELIVNVSDYPYPGTVMSWMDGRYIYGVDL